MCGIILAISKDSNKNLLTIFHRLQDRISRRGPDWEHFETFTTGNDVNLLFASSVLWLQGKSLTKQPIQDEKSIFIYNGDIFNGIPEEFRLQEGDTKYFYNVLNNADNIHDELIKLQGPYAFIYFDKSMNKIHFGRDRFGRRSLLVGKNENIIILTSVAKRTEGFEFIELPSIGTFSWDLTSNNLELYPYYKNQYFKYKVEELQLFLKQSLIIKETQIAPDISFNQPDASIVALYDSLPGLKLEEAFSTLLNNSEWLSKVIKLKELLTEAVQRRISCQPMLCKKCINKGLTCEHSSLGVLFSGGVDCSILALLADRFVEKNQPIDLFNVSFDEANDFVTPDRLTGLETLDELRSLCPNREWRFKEINVCREELDEKRTEFIADLIYPLRSILDDSLGCALWFASRGLHDSYCRVLLVGMGADELFGGYTKHRAAFKRESWLGLHNILNEDWQNLPYRNLARDDRVVSDHGRQLRTPYLDENVVNFVRGLQCWEKSYPSDKLQHGFGDKILVRCLAYHLGLTKAACLKKRALQFGSRIANKKEVAHQVSTRLG